MEYSGKFAFNNKSGQYADFWHSNLHAKRCGQIQHSFTVGLKETVA
jgi:hypothetical protein